MEMRVRDVPSHLPLVGVYSRFGWSHPGPFQFYILSIFYFLGRSSSSALLVGSLVLHMGFALISWWAVRAIDKVTAMLVLVASTALLASTAPGFVRTPWNPFVILVGGVALISLGWALAQRHRIGLVCLFPVATLLVQSHLVTAPMVLSVTTISTALMIIGPSGNSETASRGPLNRRALVLGVVIAFAMWIPPIIQQLWGDDGNFGAILRKGGGDEIRVGLAGATGVMSHAFGLVPSGFWPTAVSRTLVETTLTVPIWLILPAWGAFTAWKNRHENTNAAFLRGLSICMTAIVSVTIGVSLTTGLLTDYLIITTRPVAAATMAIGLGAIIYNLSITRAEVALQVTAIFVILGSLALGITQATGDNPWSNYRPTVEALYDSVVRNTSTKQISVEYVGGSRESEEVGAALLLQLERNGFDATSPSLDPLHAGAHRLTSHAEAQPELFVMVADISMRRELESQGWRFLGDYQPLTGQEIREVARLDHKLEQLTQQNRPGDSGDSGDENAARLATHLELNNKIAAIKNGRIPMLIMERTSPGQ